MRAPKKNPVQAVEDRRQTIKANMVSPKPLIKPSHRGLLHKDLGVKPGQKIPAKKLNAALSKAKATGNTALEKRVVFAKNFGKKRG